MKIISHRGNVDGPVPNRENHPSYIDTAIQLGYGVEIDLRYINNEFYLGHDTPDHIVTSKWIFNRKDSLWIHCKNLESAYKIKKLDYSIKFFCHTNDPYVIVNPDYLWVHDLESDLKDNCVVPLMGIKDLNEFDFNIRIYGVCTDYPNQIKDYV
jgi:hypothetical protein